MNKCYEEFKSQVETDIKAYIEGKYPEAEVTFEKMLRLNEKIDCIKIRIKNSGPVIFVNELYDLYCHLQDYALFLTDVYEIIENRMNANRKYSKMANSIKTDFNINKVGICLINREKNEELLKTLPHRTFLDLAIVYKYFICDEESLFVTNEICKIHSINEAQLYEVGMKNSRFFYDLRFMRMYDNIRKGFIENNIPLESFEYMFGKSENPKLSEWILYSQNEYYGAVGLLYDDILERLSEIFHGGFYIVPANVYECILCEASKDPQLLIDTIFTVNRKDSSASDFLSDSLYFYSSETKKVEIVNK